MPMQAKKTAKNKNAFGRKLAEELFVMGKTQRWLASQLGVTKQYISQIINGQCKPSYEMTQKIADIIGVDVATLRKLILKVS